MANSELNTQLYNKLLNNIKNKTFFELEDLRNLTDKRIQIFFVLSKKNIGKSYQIMKLFKSCLATNDKFVYVRFSRTEIDIVAAEWAANMDIPFLIKKHTIVLKTNPSKIVGFVQHISNLQNSASAQFEGVKYLIFEEIIPLDSKKLNDQKVRNIMTFISNVERIKQDFEIWMFGNLHGENRLMEKFGFGYSDNLDFRDDLINGKKIYSLFVNLRDNYVGIEKQSLTNVLLKRDAYLTKLLYNNQAAGLGDRSLDFKLKQFFNPIFGVLFNDKFIYKLSTYTDPIKQTNKRLYLLNLEIFNPDDAHKFKIITDQIDIFNKYDNIKFYHGNIKEYLKDTVLPILQSRLCFYLDSKDISEFIKHLNTKY